MANPQGKTSADLHFSTSMVVFLFRFMSRKPRPEPGLTIDWGSRAPRMPAHSLLSTTHLPAVKQTEVENAVLQA